jgi:hypothetical protein
MASRADSAKQPPAVTRDRLTHQLTEALKRVRKFVKWWQLRKDSEPLDYEKALAESWAVHFPLDAWAEELRRIGETESGTVTKHFPHLHNDRTIAVKGFIEDCLLYLRVELPDPEQGPDAIPSAVLSTEDCHVLTILEQAGRAMTYREIAAESVRINGRDRSAMPRLSDSTIRSRVRELIGLGLIARPEGTQKKGVGITDKGRSTLPL